MTQDEIIEMADKAGFFVKDKEAYSPSNQEDHELTPYLERFANLVAAKEREACADLRNMLHGFDGKGRQEMVDAMNRGLDEYQALIRERGYKQDGQCKRCKDGCPACDARKLPEQEPVAFWNFNSGFSHCMIDQLNEAAKKNPAPLYTTPPQRTWVGLTDEERQDIALEVPIDAVFITEAKLKEKNI